jgi:hypothetical protein
VYVLHSTGGPARLRARIEGYSALVVYSVVYPLQSTYKSSSFVRRPYRETHVWLPPLMIVRPLLQSELDPLGNSQRYPASLILEDACGEIPRNSAPPFV